MKLPNREDSYIPLPKLKDYLLSETHPVGKWKSKFFRSLGFNDINIPVLEKCLISIAYSEDVKDIITLGNGTKYVIDGLIETPVGKTVKVRTVWFIDINGTRPRFITAYPL
jgi:hypothetical protein